MRFASRWTALQGAKKVCVAAVKVDSQIHPSHDITVGTMAGNEARQVQGPRVYICVKCGHYAASQVVKLRQPCGPAAGCKRRQLRNVAAGFHPEGRRCGALAAVMHLGTYAARGQHGEVSERRDARPVDFDDAALEAASREAEAAEALAAEVDPAMQEEFGEPPGGTADPAHALGGFVEDEGDPFGHGEDFEWSPPPRARVLSAPPGAPS